VTGALALKRMNAATPAKAAIASWSRALSIQVAADGITVNCIAPGRIDTEHIRTRLYPTEESRQREIELNVTAGRFGEPDEVASVVTFLASTRASYVTGAMIPAHGVLQQRI
jgi:3-oxoacyl-[acyl-carrier protein] reductase